MKQLIISDGDKGGVGKSTISMVVADYIVQNSYADSTVLIEGDPGIPDVAARYGDSVSTKIIAMQRQDLAEEAVGELFAHLEEVYESGKEIVLVNLPAGAGATVNQLAVDLIAPVVEELEITLAVTHAIGSTSDCVKAAKRSLEIGLAGIADIRIAVPNAGLMDPQKMIWSRSDVRSAWLESGGTEIVLPKLATRVAARLQDELPGPLSAMAGGPPLSALDRTLLMRWLRSAYPIARVALGEETEQEDAA